MKLTWFGGTTVRIHIGGRILVSDPAGAPQGIDRRELLSGADASFGLRSEGEAMPLADPLTWQARRTPALLDPADDDAVFLWRLAGGGVLIDAVGEAPLLLATGEFGAAGRWARDAIVMVLAAEEQVETLAIGLLAALGPRLLAIAQRDSLVETTVSNLRLKLNGTALVALEPGLAIEV